MTDTKEPRKVYICNQCGSNNLLFDAWAAWDVENQCMSITTTLDEGHCCGTCGEPTHPIEVELI